MLGAAAAAPTFWSSAAAQQTDPRQAMIALVLSTKIAIATGSRERAFRTGLQQFTEIARADPQRWGSWGDSAEMAHLLFPLANPADQASYTLSAQMVLGSWNGLSAATGSNITQMRNVCGAAAHLLRNPNHFPPSNMSRGQAAVILLSCAAQAPGPERVEWAQIGLRETRAHGLRVLQAWNRQDNMTGRWATVGMALAGDAQEAHRLYAQVLANRTGAMEELAEGRRPPAQTIGDAIVNGLSGLITAASGGNPIAGMAQTMAGMPALYAEAGTIAFLAAHPDQGVEFLEQSRVDSVSERSASALSPLAMEAALARGGGAIVQVTTTSVGCLAIVSAWRGGRLVRNSTMRHTPGGLYLLETMAGYQDGFRRQRGVLQTFSQASRANARRIQQEMKEYVTLAANAARELAGGAIRTALREAQIGANQEVLVIVPAALASLPIGLSRANNEPFLAQSYQLRFATSLRAAYRSAEQARTQAAPSLAIVAPSGRNAPPFAAFENAVVRGHYPENARRVGQGANGAAVLSSLSGAETWHIASHGVWDFRNQERSGLLLVGSTPTTVAHVMANAANPPPRLVYLSACSTNLINIERDLNAFVGLNTAFLAAGATGVIGAQWAVNDVASALLAARFYDGRLARNLAPAAALRAAQLWLKDASAADMAEFVQSLTASGKITDADSEAILGQLADLGGDAPPFADPYYWGGFQFYGA